MTVQEFLTGLWDRVSAEFAEPKFPENDLQRPVNSADIVHAHGIISEFVAEALRETKP